MEMLPTVGQWFAHLLINVIIRIGIVITFLWFGVLFLFSGEKWSVGNSK